MNDHDALLRAICENPREDTPRLVFADWLEENGQPEYAAYIRTDIAMSLRDEWDLERLNWEENWERALMFDDGRFPWLYDIHTPLPERATWTSPPITRRGFPWGVGVWYPDKFLAVTDELFGRQPIEHLTFWSSPGSAVPAQPWFAHIRGLDLHAGVYPPQSLTPLLQAARELRELVLRQIAVRTSSLDAMFASGFLRQLTRFGLASNRTQFGRFALTQLTHANQLHTLELTGGLLGDAVIVIGDHIPPGVRVLDLQRNQMNSQRTVAFTSRPRLSQLRILNLSSNPLGNAGATAVFTSPHLTELKVLNLSYCYVGDEALRALLENSPLADGLNRLVLTGSPASADMKEAVKARMGDRVRL